MSALTIFGLGIIWGAIIMGVMIVAHLPWWGALLFAWMMCFAGSAFVSIKNESAPVDK